MENSHQPVMTNEVLALFQDLSIAPKRYLDGTFGRGGHASLMSKQFPDLSVWAVDQDQTAVDFAQSSWNNESTVAPLQIEHSNFSEILDVIEKNNWPKNFDMILLDLGVSSPQLDISSRGFSFYKDGPLDMRMNMKRDLSAATIINEWDSDSLFQLFTELGEVRRPGRVIRAIIEDRKTKSFETTLQLAGMIERVDGWRKKGKHPATNYFLALRLEVNKELDVLRQALPILVNLLSPGGRLAILSFHSLEDRIVKHFFKECQSGRPVSKKVIKPQRAECLSNKRARSALLRGFEKNHDAASVQIS